MVQDFLFVYFPLCVHDVPDTVYSCRGSGGCKTRELPRCLITGLWKMGSRRWRVLFFTCALWIVRTNLQASKISVSKGVCYSYWALLVSFENILSICDCLSFCKYCLDCFDSKCLLFCNYVKGVNKDHLASQRRPPHPPGRQSTLPQYMLCFVNINFCTRSPAVFADLYSMPLRLHASVSRCRLGGVSDLRLSLQPTN